MKKLVFALMFVFAGMGVYAQEAEIAQAEVDGLVVSVDAFEEISIDQLPEAVTEAVATNYPSATIDKAYVNENNQYKLEVSMEDGTKGTLYADAEGNWIDM